MDGLQQQINTLNQKVEQLNYIVERLSGQLTHLTTHTADSSSVSPSMPTHDSLQPLPKLSHRIERQTHPHVVPSHESMETELVGNHHKGHSMTSSAERYRHTLEHKDILVEDNIPQTVPDPVQEPSVSSDIQIRRLMAQLTAAYNRIAILEEQLLACRRHN